LGYNETVEKFIERIKRPVKGIMREIAASLNEMSRGKVKPYQITILSVLLHGFIVVAIYNDQLFQAGIMLIFFGLLDSVDGALARIQNSESNGGILLDSVADRIKEIMIYTAIGYWLVINESVGYASLAILALGGSMLVSFVKTKGEAIVAKANDKLSSTDLNRLFSTGVMRFEVRMFLLVIALLTGEILITVGLIALFAWMSAISQLLNVIEHLSKDA